MRRLSSRHLKIQLVVLAAYILLALVTTLPLAGKFSTHVPGDGIDSPPLTWNLWWVKYALVDLGSNPFNCDYLFYPLKINLAFYTLTVLNGAISIPLQGLIGLISASNLLVLSSFVLGAWGAFLLVEHILTIILTPWIKGETSDHRRYWTIQLHLAAFVGGFVYAFCSSKLFFAALGQFNIASSQWIPYYILFLFKMRQSPERIKYPLLAGLFLLFQTWAEMTYASFLIIFTTIFCAYHLLSGQRSQSLYRFLLGLLAMTIIFVIGISPIMAMMLPDLAAEGNFMVEGTGFAGVFSSDLLGLVVPTQLHPLLGSLVSHFNFPHDKGQHLFLGYITLALSIYGLVRWSQRGVIRFWTVSTLGFLILCLGPVAQVNGTATGVTLPFQILQHLPLFNGNRYPGRISVMVVLGLAVLIGFGTWSLLQRFAQVQEKQTVRVALALVLVLLLGLEHLSVPLPMVKMSVPEVYHIIGQDPSDSTLLDIPVAWRNGFRVTGTMDPIIMLEQFYQTVHHKRILAGNTSRNPEQKFQYFTELPVLNSIIALETGHKLDPDVAQADAVIAEKMLRFLDVRYIIVHTAQAGPDMVPYIEATMPVERFYANGDTVAYRVKLQPPDPETKIDLGTPLAAASLGAGWGEAYDTEGYVWAQRDGARLMVLLDGQAKTMSGRIWAPGPRQVLRMDVNGEALPGLELAEGWGEYQLHIPAKSLRNGLNRVRLRFSRLFPVKGVLPQGHPLGESNISVPVNILVKSAGNEIGDFGHVFLNGTNVSREGVGYNIVFLDPKTNIVITSLNFNTYASERASQDLADWVRRVPEGTLALVSVRDEASQRLGETAVTALQSLGLQGDLRNHFRWSHAAIGAKGLAPGQALEDLQALRPARVRLGLGVTEPQVAAAFDWLQFSPEPVP